LIRCLGCCFQRCITTLPRSRSQLPTPMGH